MRRSSTWNRVAAAVAIASLWSAAAPAAAPASDSPAGHTVQMVHWWEAYKNALPDPEPRPLIREIGSDEEAEVTLPSLRPGYDRTFTPSGMDAVFAESLGRTKARLAGADAAALRGYTLRVGRCSTSGPALLTTVTTSDKKICVATILAAAIYFESVGIEMERLSQRLVQMGVDPRNFSGDYEPRLNQRGVTRNDWAAFLGAYEPEWKRLRGSADYLSAHIIQCDVLRRASASCAGDAAILAAAASGGLELSSLRSAIVKASEKYDPASWGYRTAGDGDEVARELMAIRTP